MKTLTESKKYPRLVFENEGENENNKKFISSENDIFSHKESKDTCKINDSLIELEEEENEFIILFFSFLNKDLYEIKNETLSGYYQKAFCSLINQIRIEVLYLLSLLKKFKIITYVFKNERIIKNILNNLHLMSIQRILSEILIPSIDYIEESIYQVI